MAIDGHRSTFVGGGSIDQFTEMVDLSPSEKVAAIRWQTLKLQNSLDSAEQIEFDNLTTQLSNKIFSAEKFNTLADCIVALEIFFRDNVEGYITTKQQEFDATLQKFSDQGIWSNITTYQQWNTISFNNETFLSRKDNNLNHTPVGDVTDIWWHKVAQRGRQGEPGLGLRFTGLFSISRTYSENDAVAYYGDDGYAIYYCLSTCMGIEPTDANHWAIFMSLAQLSSIIGDTNNLLTEDKSSLVNAFNEVFQSVSDGKAQLETAITDMRGAVSKEGEIVAFDELEDGIRSIPISKGNALPQYVLEPYTFTNEDGIEYTGTMPNRGAVNHSLPINGSFTISQGCHNGLGQVTQSVPTKSAATYNPSQSDQTISANQYLTGNQTIKAVPFDASKVLNDTMIAGKQGTMPNRGTVNQTITTQGGQYTIPNGYHNGLGKVTANLDVEQFVNNNLRVVNGLESKKVTARDTNIHDVFVADNSAVYCKYNGYSYSIRKYDSVTLNVLGTIVFGGQFYWGGVGQDKDYLYAKYNNIIHKVSKLTMTTVGTVASGGASIVADDDYIYSGTGSTVTKHNKNTLQSVGSSESMGMRISFITHDNNYLYVGFEDSSAVRVLNKSNLTLISSYSFGISEGSDCISLCIDSTHIYGIRQLGDGIGVINRSDGTVQKLTGATSTYGMVADENYVYVSDYTNPRRITRIPKINNATGTIISVNSLSSFTHISSNSNYIYGEDNYKVHQVFMRGFTF